MASQTPVFIQNENLPIHRGKGADGIKLDVPKPAKAGRQDRKALRDLSKAGKPLTTAVSKGSTLKDKSAVPGKESTKNTLKDGFLSEEELKRCQEWAKEGIEETHFTGNDLQNLQKEQQEERVRKKVDKVMSALREWTNMAYGFGMLKKDISDDIKGITKMELVAEELPSRINILLDSGKDEIEDIIPEQELDPFPYIDHVFEFKLKEEFDTDVSCF